MGLDRVRVGMRVKDGPLNASGRVVIALHTRDPVIEDVPNVQAHLFSPKVISVSDLIVVRVITVVLFPVMQERII